MDNVLNLSYSPMAISGLTVSFNPTEQVATINGAYVGSNVAYLIFNIINATMDGSKQYKFQGFIVDGTYNMIPTTETLPPMIATIISEENQFNTNFSNPTSVQNLTYTSVKMEINPNYVYNNLKVGFALYTGTTAHVFVPYKYEDLTLKIRPRVFFEDVKISQKQHYDTYKNLLKSSTVSTPYYSDATNEIKKINKYDLSGNLIETSFLGADVLNDIEDRIYIIERYLLGASKIKPTLVSYNSSGPNPFFSGMHWISNINVDQVVVPSLLDSTSMLSYEYNDSTSGQTIGLIE